MPMRKLLLCDDNSDDDDDDDDDDDEIEKLGCRYLYLNSYYVYVSYCRSTTSCKYVYINYRDFFSSTQKGFFYFTSTYQIFQNNTCT